MRRLFTLARAVVVIATAVVGARLLLGRKKPAETAVAPPPDAFDAFDEFGEVLGI